MRETVTGLCGLLLAGSFAGVLALRSSAPALQPKHPPAMATAPIRLTPRISDADVIVGRPFDGPRMEHVLRGWSRRVHRRKARGLGHE